MSWFSRWRKPRPKETPPARGITLEPGESIEIGLPPAVDELLGKLHAAGHAIAFQNGPIETDGARYKREVEITVDGKPFASFEIGWNR